MSFSIDQQRYTDTEEMLAFQETGYVRQARQVIKQDTAQYTDEAQFSLDKEGIFKHIPLMLAASYELMLLIFLDTLDIAQRRFTQAVESDLSTTACLHTLLPTDDESRDNWKAWTAFWNMKLTDTEFRNQQVERTENTLQRIRGLLERDSGRSSKSAEKKDIEERRIFAVIVGIAIQAILINNKGERFIAEDSYHGRSAQAIMEQPETMAYLVKDSAIFAYPEVDHANHRLIDGWETIEEMEAGLNLPKGSLQRTMAEYNEGAARGEDAARAAG